MRPHARTTPVPSRPSSACRVPSERSQNGAARSTALCPAQACPHRSFPRLVPPAVARPRAPLAPKLLIESP
jgi:hypothetical protein